MLRDHRAVIAARVFVGLIVLVAAFQLALAAGAPWGRLTMAGRYPGQLPVSMRFAAAAQAMLLLLFGVVIAARARLMFPRLHGLSRRLVWLVITYTVAGTVLNAITPSPWERVLWLPIVLVLGVSAAVVARSD